MRLKICLMLCFALLIQSCGATSGTHSPSKGGGPPHGPPSPIFLPPSIPPEQLVKPEKGLWVKASRDKGVGRKASTPARFLKGSRLDNPLSTIFFPFDNWELNTEVRDQLKATAHLMHCFPNHLLRIEGYTDGQGPESYKMVLGAKRTQVIKEYLGRLGISAQRLETVSYGKAFMLCEFEEEPTCQQFNRRAELFLEQQKFLTNARARKCIVRLQVTPREYLISEQEAWEVVLLPALSDGKA